MSEKVPLIWGTDPEAFASYSENGKLHTLPPYYFRKVLDVPHYVEPQDTKAKHPVFFDRGVYKLIEDGAAFEMTIQPSHSPKELWERIQACAEETSELILSEFPEDCDPVLRFIPTIGFDVKRWENMPEDFRMSTMFGCDPSKDAWNMSKKSSITDASLHAWRYGGGHLHISGSEMIAEDPIRAIQCMSVTAGNAAIAYSKVPNLEKMRTFEYGIPGNFRVQRYGKKNPFGPAYAVGVEYRTISDSWCGDWNLAEKVFQWAEIGIRNLLETNLAQEILDDTGEASQQAILNCDQEMSRQILSYIESRI